MFITYSIVNKDFEIGTKMKWEWTGNRMFHLRFERKAVKGICLSAVCSLLLTGCGSEQAQEQENLIIVEQYQNTVEFSLAEATVGDVVKIKKIRCDYEQLESLDMSFAVEGKEIKKVYVNAGDSVKKGQLLAELDIGDVDGKVRELEYKIAKNNLLLEHLDENENNEISAKWANYLYQSSHSDEKEEALKESIAKLQQQNEYTREDYRDAIAMDSLELDWIKAEIADCYLYAGMDGTVSYVKPNMEGTLSDDDYGVISIIAEAEGIFVVEDTEYAPYFTEGVEVELNIISGIGAGDYVVVPFKMEEWDEERLLFTFAENTDIATIKMGAIGTIKIITGMREQVLNIPSKAVHMAEDREYVYVVGEGNVREVRWITTGLYGDNTVEILSGLSEGEKVILK